MSSNKNYTRSSFKRIFHFLALEKEELTLIYGYAILGGVIGLSLPLGIQAVMNLIVAGQASSSWYVLVSLIVIGIAFIGVLQILQISILERLQQRIMVKGAFDLSFRVPRWKMEAILKQYAPELMNRFFDILGLQKGLAKLLVGFLSAFLQIVFAILGVVAVLVLISVVLFYGFRVVLLIGAALWFVLSAPVYVWRAWQEAA
jgi:ABC-type bacteriocin/lantibiotic exporter with double-glycine peptidase domain